MEVSTKARYAARAMIELALNYGNGPLQLREIARRQEISNKYLEQVMFPLRTRGYIHTQKGSHGGYSLSKDPREITLFEIMKTGGGSLTPVACVDNPGTCSRVAICATREVWSRLQECISTELKSVTLDALAKRQVQKQRDSGDSLFYQI